MKNLFTAALAACLFFGPGLTAVQAETFTFLYQPGQKFRYTGLNHQTVSVNGRVIQKSEIILKIPFSVTKVENGRGWLTGIIQEYQERDSVIRASKLQNEYLTEFWRDARGTYTISPAMVMPVVRNVPWFPETDLKPGDRWTAPGMEVHDLKTDFGVPELLRVPIDVAYQFKGDVQAKGRTFKQITANYNIFVKTGFRYPGLSLYPVTMTGYSRQTILWDAENGRPDSYTEDYNLMLIMNTGDIYEFYGTASSDVVEATNMDKPKLVDSVKKDLGDRGMGAVEVRPTDKGVVINLDNINFPPDSAVLVPEEQAKIRLLAEILKKYPDRDLLVEGHTALAGRAEDRQSLSEARAAAVGNYLLNLGVRKSEQMAYRGWGASKPLADNATAEGMRKNRRVEITILEN